MTSQEKIRHADALREKALRSIRLAEGLGDDQARQALMQLSHDLTAQADELDGQTAAAIRHLLAKDSPQG